MRRNSDAAKAALCRTADHFARAVIELSQARKEMLQVRHAGSAMLVIDEGLKFLREQQRTLLDKAKAPLGMSLRSETPEEGP